MGYYPFDLKLRKQKFSIFYDLVHNILGFNKFNGINVLYEFESDNP